MKQSVPVLAMSGVASVALHRTIAFPTVDKNGYE